MDLETLLKSVVGTLVRHGGNAIGTVLIGRGWIDQAAANNLTEMMVGASIIVAMAIYSVISKKKALETPAK